MKVLSSIVMLMLPFVARGQNLTEVGFLDSTYTWTEYHRFYWGGGALSFRYTIDSQPTAFSGKDYYAVLSSSDEDPYWRTEGYIRFENKVVYPPEDYPLYDFNLMVGDTFESDYPLVVDSIDTFTLLNGEIRKRWKLRCPEDEPGEFPYTEWVEGIGNIDGLYAINSYSHCVFDTDGSDIMCLSRNDTLLYDDPVYDSCWIPIVVEPIVGFLNSSYTWTEAYYDPFSSNVWSKRYTIDSVHTSFSGRVYYEVLSADSEISSDWVGTGNFIRYEHKSVLGNSGGDEYSLYYFNLNVGGSFPLYYITSDLLRLIVEEVDTFTLVNGERKKYLKLQCNNLDPGSDYYLEWVEGIGNLNGLYANETMCFIDAPASTILCMYRNDTLILDDPDEEGCWIMRTSTQEASENKVVIKPNPVTEYLEISGIENDIRSIKVINSLGILIDLSEGDRINLQHLPAGYYYAVIVFNDNHTLTKGFIKS